MAKATKKAAVKKAPAKKPRGRPRKHPIKEKPIPDKAYHPSAVVKIGLAAKLIGVTTTRIRQLVEEGRVERPRNGYVVLGTAIKGHADMLREALEKAKQNTSLDTARQAKTRETEIRIAQRMRELIPLEDAMAGVDAIVARVNSELAGMPARITRDKILRKKVEAEIDGSRNRIADAVGKAGETLVAGGDVLETLAENSSR